MRIRTAVFITLLLLTVLSVSAASAADTWAKGDKIVISGTATGNPQQGLAFWVFGPNYWSRDTQSVSGREYSYEIPGAMTANLASGQYYCIIQHPGYNGQFDVDISGNKAVSTAGQSFILDGPGRLNGRQAAYALTNLLDSPNIDDTYTMVQFTLEEPRIEFQTGSTYAVGNNLYIGGTTNLAVGDKLIYEVSQSSFGPTPKTKIQEVSGSSGTITVQRGVNGNIWGFYLDTSSLVPDTYSLMVESDDGRAVYSGTFTLVSAPAQTPSQTSDQTSAPSAQTSAQTDSQQAAQTPSPEASGGYMSIILAVTAIAGFALFRRC